MACGIYKITNLINNKSYIGQSIDIKRRWRAEKSAAFNEKSKNYNTVLSKAFRKYCTVVDNKVDFSNFSFDILEECSVEFLNEREQYYVDKYNTYCSGYNMTEGGDTVIQHVLDKTKLLQIIECLRTDSHKNSEQIGKEFNVSGRMVRHINNGTSHRLADIEYPIRPKYISDPKNKVFRQAVNDGYSEEEAKQLAKIARFGGGSERKTKCPSQDVLFEQLYKTSFTDVGKLYGVSSTAVQKWLKKTTAPTNIKAFKVWYESNFLSTVS